MVSRKLSVHTMWGSEEDLQSEIHALKKFKIQRVKDLAVIKKICHDVILAVQSLWIIPVDPSTLAQRKVKKQIAEPIISDAIRWNDEARIHHDWKTENWKQDAIKWWVYYDTDASVLATIYADTTGELQVYMKRAIARNPIGANLLIKSMKHDLVRLLGKNL